MADVRSTTDPLTVDMFASRTGTPIVIRTDTALAYFLDGANNIIQLGTGDGSVESVAFTAPVQYTVTGSPITTSGTIALNWNAQIANTGLMGPTGGGAAVPTFRSLVASDIPNLSATYVLTSTTVNGKALSSNITLLLASADFANQGTTTTVLHGNAAGNPSFGSIVTGDIAAAAVTYAKIQNVTDVRLLGNSSGGAGPPMEITVGSGLSLSAGALTATGGGTGDVVGPASATDNAIARFDGTTGKLIQNSAATVDDTTGAITSPTVIGGIGVGSTLSLQATSGAGSTEAILFKGGTNGGTEFARFIHGGSLGLGVTNPVETLQINGAMKITGTATTNLANSLSTDFSSGFSRWISYGPNTSTLGGMQFYQATSNNTGSSGVKLTLTTASKFGFLTGSPDEVVQVNGAVKVTGTTTTNTVSSGSFDYASGSTRIVTYGPDTSTLGGWQIYQATSNNTGSSGLKLVLTNASQLLLGGSTALTVGNAGAYQVAGTSAATSQMQSSGFANDATTAGTLALSKSRSGTLYTNTIVQSGDVIGNIVAYGANGSTYTNGGRLQFTIGATPGATNDMPTNATLALTGDGSGTLTDQFVWTFDGRVYAKNIHNNAGSVTGTTNQYFASGTYTPTLTNVANLDASTSYQAQWIRVGNVVTVSGKVDVDPTLATTSTQLGISLPIASNIGAAEDCAGTAFASGIAGQGAAILGDATNDRAQMQWISTDLTNQPMYFSFTYEVL